MSITATLTHLSPQKRLETRRRINAIVDFWTKHLRHKYGDEALYRCRCHQVTTAKNGSLIRNRIWSQVAVQLRASEFNEIQVIS